MQKRQRHPAPVPKEELFRRCLEALGCDREDLEGRTRLLADERKAVAHLLRRLGLLKLTEIGDLLKVGEGQASKLVGEGQTILRENAGLRRRLKGLTEDPAE